MTIKCSVVNGKSKEVELEVVSMIDKDDLIKRENRIHSSDLYPPERSPGSRLRGKGLGFGRQGVP